MFHLSGKMFLPEKFVDPLVDFRNTGIVFCAVVHTITMVKMVMLDSRLRFAKKKPLAQLPTQTSCATLRRSSPGHRNNLLFAKGSAAANGKGCLLTQTFPIHQDSGANKSNSSTSDEKFVSQVFGYRVVNSTLFDLDYHRDNLLSAKMNYL
jgi:hypothetical protein